VNVKPQQIYRVAHDRNPMPAETFGGAYYDPKRHLMEALCSSEFQASVSAKILRAYPEKPRDVFVHVPKCAGTDFILNRAQSHAALLVPKMLDDEGWIPKEELFEWLKTLAAAAPHFDKFFVYGHLFLKDYIDGVGVRAEDRIFTILRDPIDLLISQANYAITRMRQDPFATAPDTKEFFSLLGLQALPAPISLSELRELAVRALLHPEIARPNSICLHLGSADPPLYRTAIANVIAHEVEITTTSRYVEWLARRWRIVAGPRHNESDHWLRRSDLSDDVLDDLQQRTAEDRVLFAVVSEALDRSGAVSVRGNDIPALLGLARVEDWTADRIQRASPPASHGGPSLEPVVAQGRRAVEERLASPAVGTPVLEFDLGIAGNGSSYLRGGWAKSEPSFTWTAATEVVLELPKPKLVGDYVLRLTAGPYVVADRLPEQRLTVAANGIVLGTIRARERAILDFPLPRPVLGGSDWTTYRFSVPDAAKPRDLTSVNDDRLLGFAIEKLELFLSRPEKTGTAAVSVLVGKDVIARHLARIPSEPAVAKVGFGQDAVHKPILRDGWAAPEASFTWATARISRVALPKPLPPADYLVRLLAGPFVIREGSWPEQRIGIAVNGMGLGSAVVRDRAVIECVLPSCALPVGELPVFSFSMPDAVRPHVLGASDDARLLGFAFESLELFSTGTRFEPAPAPANAEPGQLAEAQPRYGS
jgi:hypothetical protein